jgi:ribonucleoside-diphosphate reductase alpha chain
MNKLIIPKKRNNIKSMEVVKRNGEKEKVSFDKIIKRIDALCWGLDTKWIDPINIAKDTIKSLYDGISTEEIDFVSSKMCAYHMIDHPDFGKLAARICISNLHKTTDDNFLEVAKKLHNNEDILGNKFPLLSDEVFNIIVKNIDEIQSRLDYSRDFNFTFFGIKTLERSYLMRIKNIRSNDIKEKNEKTLRKKYGKIVERPQHLLMRVALGIHNDDLKRVFQTYDLMSNRLFTHATPTLFNSGTPRPQLSSCFLLPMEDSITGIFKTVADAAQISKWAGGIGIHLSAIRSAGSHIRGTNGTSDGIIPLCRLLNMEAKYVNQGGKRNGSIAIYVEPWHGDIWEFCELRKNTGEEELRARDLFLALWIPDLFMKRVENDEMWSLMCQDECPGLQDAYGEKFDKLYESYERMGKYIKQIKAKELWHHILVSQIETGMPYMVYKDHVNRKSNQKNLGTIRSSNLCSEIVEYSDKDNYAVCNLASICLPRYLEEKDGVLSFNFQKLYDVTRVVTYNLNKVIDRNFYPVPETKSSNMKNRPVGMGVQGLADVYNRMSYSFGSDEARHLNRKIFETIYFAALTESNEIAKTEGVYESYDGSPISKGLLQFDLWELSESELLMDWDWKTLRESIKKHGVRNSLLTAVMPTASTSQIMGCIECIEPYTTNLYVRTTIAGEFTVLNENLVRDLIKKGLWTQQIRDEILFDNGSVQNLDELDKHTKEVYLGAFEMGQVHIVNQAIERGPFIDQSQSLNIFMRDPDFKKLTKCHFYGWQKGLKTGMYYLRSQPSVDPIKFGLDPLVINKIKQKRGTVTDIYFDPSHNTNSTNDPRRINEIDDHQKAKKPRFVRPGKIEECEMCSG